MNEPRTDLPKRVFPKNGRFYYVVANGRKRIWHRLTRIEEGIPALYVALATKKRELETNADGMSTVPGLVDRWMETVMVKRSAKTQIDDVKRCNKIKAAFEEFRPSDVTPPDCVEFLDSFADKPRTYNAYRSLIRELMRFAEERGKRPAGSNPIDSIRTAKTRPRERCPTTSEIRRVKIGCLYGNDGKRTPSGIMMACIIEMLYLTGQDVGVVVRILEQRDPMQPEEPHVTNDGIWFRRDKTGKTVEIEWTPRLRALVNKLKALKAERMLKKRAAQRIVTPRLFTKTDGTPLNYEAVANAWQKGIKRAKVAHFMLRDVRAAAMTDKEEAEGMRAANAMGTHSTEAQTADYVRARRARKTKATR